MDFVNGLPLMPSKKDSVWVIVDWLTKSAHFIPVHMDYWLQKLAKLYVSGIVRLHGVPVSIISNRYSRFTSRFWKKVTQGIGCCTPSCWTELGEQRILGPQLVSDTRIRQKSYTYLKRKEIEFSVEDLVFLKVSPWKKVLSSDPTHIVSTEEIEIRPNLTFEEEPVQILDSNVEVLRRKFVPLVKVVWRNHNSKEATLEPGEAMRQQYPHLF
ncbi:uncharacterized protein [Gossypium hirsutum]|uniref:Uncharacterized protein n=1 Tax=Gossypium hirsutum TaxID=3635 RepID=A0ABM2ZBL2_GOSHI|nr:uncharacterized protein LOC121211392 [Gossypium hirsutum]